MPDPYFRSVQRRQIRRLALAALVSLVVADVAVSLFVLREGTFGWRSVPPFGAICHPRQQLWLDAQHAELEGRQAPGIIAQFDAELGWCNVKARGTEPGGRLGFTYNSLGARSLREYAAQPPDGVVRLACFGESFTHCDEVGDTDTWECQLEQLGPRYEALNFGVGGYGTDQALLRFRREGLHGAQVACIGFMPENIGRNVNRYRPLWHPSSNNCVVKPRFVLVDEQLQLVPNPYATRAELVEAVATGRVIGETAEHEYWAAETRMGWLRFSSCLRLAAAWWAYDRRDVPKLFARSGDEPFTTTVALLESFAREASQRGAKFAPVLILPREEDLRSFAIAHDRYWSGLVAELERRQVVVIDMTPELAPAWLASREDPALPRMFAGGHLSGAANAIVARVLREHVDARLPAER